MLRLLEISEPSALNNMSVSASLPRFYPDDLNRHAPNAHWVILDKAERITGRCSLWWQHSLRHEGHAIGLIGHYAADDMQTGQQLLANACKELAGKGCTLAVGPMDGNTWRSYRFVTAGKAEAPFFLEPANPPTWPRQFEEYGFKRLSNYFSSLDDRLNVEDDAQARRAARRMADLGVRLRTLDMAHFDEELKAIYRIVTTSFQRGFLYQSISEAEFVTQYDQVRPYVQPELVTIAMHEDQPIGFIFTLPDMLSARLGKPIETAIVKTLCVLPDRRFAGLGTHLGIANRRAVHQLGYRRMIHALMHESNASRCISARYASTVFRRYSLFARLL